MTSQSFFPSEQFLRRHLFYFVTCLCFSPVLLAEDGQRRSQVKLGSAADFSLDIHETDLSLLTASIKSPSGRDEPCLLKRMANNHIGNSTLQTHTHAHVWFEQLQNQYLDQD